jgi:hypothetical protein
LEFLGPSTCVYAKSGPRLSIESCCLHVASEPHRPDVLRLHAARIPPFITMSQRALTTGNILPCIRIGGNLPNSTTMVGRPAADGGTAVGWLRASLAGCADHASLPPTLTARRGASAVPEHARTSADPVDVGAQSDLICAPRLPEVTLTVHPRRWHGSARGAERPKNRPLSRTRLFRFLRFGLLRLYPLSWTFGRLLVPLLFRHCAPNLAVGAEAIEPSPLVSSLSRRCRTNVRSLARRKSPASVRTGSVPQRSRTGISSHQRSPTVQTNRRLSPLQLKQQG